MNLENRLLKTDGLVGGRLPAPGGLCAAGSAGAAGALGAEERPASFRGVSSMPWAPGLGAFRGLGPGRLTWLSGREGRNLRPLLERGLEVVE